MANAKRKTTFTIAIVFIFSALSGCQTDQDYPSWMLGSWKTQFNGFEIVETWNKANHGYSAVTIWNDHGLKSKEQVKLYYEHQKLVYQVQVDHKKTKFICEDVNNDTLVFYNKYNDYPKRIIYTRPVHNEMKVWVDNFPDDPNTSYFNFRKQ